MRRVRFVAVLAALVALSLAPAGAHEDGCAVVGPGVGVDEDQEWVVSCTIENAPAGTYEYVAVAVNDWEITVNDDRGDRWQPPIQARVPTYPDWAERETGTFEVPAGATIVATIEGGCGGPLPVALCGTVGYIEVEKTDDGYEA